MDEGHRVSVVMDAVSPCAVAQTLMAPWVGGLRVLDGERIFVYPQPLWHGDDGVTARGPRRIGYGRYRDMTTAELAVEPLKGRG